MLIQREGQTMSENRVEKMLSWVKKNPPEALDPNTAKRILDTWLSAASPPADLRFLYPALDITYKALSVIRKSDDDEAFFNTKCSETLSSWLTLFRHLLDRYQAWTTETAIQSIPPVSTSRDKHLLQGHIGDHPVYAALLQYPEYKGPARERYYRLMALLIVASCLASRENWRGQPGFLSREQAAGLAVRKVALSRKARKYDLTSPSLLNKATSLTCLLESLRAAHADSTLIVKQYRRYVLDALGTPTDLGGGGGGGRGGFHHSYGSWPDDYVAIDPGTAIDPDDNAGPNPKRNILRPNRRGFHHGITPGELAGSMLLLCPDNLDKKGRDRNDWSLERQLHNFEMRNHYLPLHYDQLSPVELAAALNAVHAQAVVEPTLIAALQLVVLMGIPWSEIPKITVQREYDIELIDSTSFIINLNSSGFWLIPVKPPAYQGEHQFDPAASRPHETWLKIPDSWGLGALISRSNEESPFGAYTEQTLRKSVHELLKKAGTDRRVTLAKLQHFLPMFLLTRVTHDPAIAGMLTQRELRGITQSHYTTLCERHLIDYWLKAHTLLATELQEAGYKGPARPVDDPSETTTKPSHVFVGSRLCPDTRKLQTLIADLKTMLAKRPNSLSDRIEYHNKYTWYTALFCAYATGYRAVVDPIILGDEIDRHSQTAIICDKSHQNDSMARRVPIVNGLIEHMNRVEKHHARMDLIVRTLNTSPVKKGFYFIDSGRNLVSVTPSRLAEFAPVDYPYPINANRRYIRSRFVEMGVPGPVIDAFLGHWTRSRAPHSKYGSADPILLEAKAKSAVDSLLDELGFEHINSMLIRV